MNLFRFLSIIISTIFCMTGCSSVTPRENFVNFRNCDIGRHVSQLIVGDDLGTKTRTLDNGNVEYTREGANRGRCVLVREIDSKTDRIVAWRTVGDDSGCEIVP